MRKPPPYGPSRGKPGRFWHSAVMAAALLLLWAAEAGAQADTAGADYRWPTNASHRLSSTFAETRSAHFHAALDIKTWGQQGYDVYATRPGTLHRIAIGPKGYGKVLYLRHDDGSFSVYAHLLAFEESVQQLADSLRMPDYSFELDREVDSLGIVFRQGEKIGISGATGIGPPHLHFELRTPDHRPFNPLLTNLAVEDDLAPAFAGLAVEPLTPASRVEGEHRIYRKRASRAGRSAAQPVTGGPVESGGEADRWYEMGTVDVLGEVGLAVDVYDQSNGVYNAYAVYELKMWVDGELLFHSRVDSFSYDKTGQMHVDRVYPLLQATGRGYQRLWIADGNTLPFYRIRGTRSGRLSLRPGSHEVRIEASDYFGNRSRARLTLRAEDPEEREEDLPAYNGAGAGSHRAGLRHERLEPGSWQWNSDWLHIPASGLEGLQMGVEGREGLHFHPGGVSVDLRRYLRLYLRRALDSRLTLRRVHPGREAWIIEDPAPADKRRLPPPPGVSDVDLPLREAGTFAGDGGLSPGKAPIKTLSGGLNRVMARFPAGAFYDTASVGLQVRRLGPDSVRIDIHPAGIPVGGEYEIRIPPEMAGEELGLYHFDERKGRLNVLESRRAEGWLAARAEKLGRFYLLADRQTPELDTPRAVRRPDGRWVVTVRAEDNLSGIDYGSARFEVNGVRGIAEYEPGDDRLVYYRPGFEPSGEMRLRIRIADRAGNRVERTFLLEAGVR